jgi:hypothetical protein
MAEQPPGSDVVRGTLRVTSDGGQSASSIIAGERKSPPRTFKRDIRDNIVSLKKMA